MRIGSLTSTDLPRILFSSCSALQHISYLHQDRTLTYSNRFIIKYDGFHHYLWCYYTHIQQIMNALGVSVIFVICSILLSFVRDIVFQDSQPPTSIIRFNKILQLSDNQMQRPNESYKSLYEAYYKHQAFDAHKASNSIRERNKFNQSVLSESVRNEESSLMCGPDFLVLIFSGVSINAIDRVQWVNTFCIYKLPLMRKIKQFEINGKMMLPLECKRNNAQLDMQYEIGVISKETFSLIKIYEDSAYISYTKTRESLRSEDTIHKFDFYGTWFAYWSQDKPWIVSLENIQVQEETIQINLLSQEDKQKSSLPHQFNVHSLLLGYSERLYLGIILNHHRYNDPTKNIYFSTYFIQEKKPVHIWKRIIDSNVPTHDHAISDCVIYINQETLRHDLSCLITKTKQNLVRFINIEHAFKIVVKQEEQENQQPEQERGWIDDYLFSFTDDEDVAYDSQAQNQGLANKNDSYLVHTFTIKNPSHQMKKIVKPSIPNPILYYERQHKHYLFSIAFEESESLPFLQFQLTPPNSESKQASLRDIMWVEGENYVLILWTTGIEVYQYSCVKMPQKDGEGIAMSVILPFIELFATVFCLLRIVWNTD